MDAVEHLVIFRGVERIIVVLGGLLCIVCGMMLYKWATAGNSELVFENKLSKFRLINASPGMILGLYGAVILGWAAWNKLVVGPDDPVSYKNEKNKSMGVTAKDVGEEKGKTLSKRRFSYDVEIAEELNPLLRDFVKRNFDDEEKKKTTMTTVKTFQKDIERLLDKNDAKTAGKNE